MTYLLEGRMRHKDSAGNEGVIEANGVQWMTAGKGIIHSEMPEQEDGLLMGFQLWVNMPKADKMTEPSYQGFAVRPTYLDIALPAGVVFEQSLDYSDNAFIFVIEGDVKVGEKLQSLGKRRLGILSGGERVVITAGKSDSRFLLVAGQPLNEPVTRGGPLS